MATAANIVRISDSTDRANRLFAEIGRFLAEHRLSADPAHYAFAYRVLSEPDSKIADTVQALTDGGVRLTQADIAALGHHAVAGAPVGLDAPAPCDPQEHPAEAQAEKLVSETHTQMRGFETIVRAIHDETRDFGRDLAASADAMRGLTSSLEVDGLMRVTGTMLARIKSAEERLEAATDEAKLLREKLEEARDDARRDPLTDLPNRRAFGEAFFAQRNAAETMSLALCDIDRFKSVNDRFGHGVGDRVLKAIAASLGSCCPAHLIARHGGEEFAILFTGIDAPEAYRMLDEARETVAEKRYRLRESDAPLGAITFSAGLVTVLPGEPLEDVLMRADALLYAAKDGGRNRIEVG